MNGVFGLAVALRQSSMASLTLGGRSETRPAQTGHWLHRRALRCSVTEPATRGIAQPLIMLDSAVRTELTLATRNSKKAAAHKGGMSGDSSNLWAHARKAESSQDMWIRQTAHFPQMETASA